MTVLAYGKLANLKRSLDVYFNAQFGATFPNAIDWVGVPFDDTGLAEWVQPRLLGPAHPPWLIGRRSDPVAGTRAAGVIPIFQVNAFVRPAKQTKAHRLEEIRDLCASAYQERTRIAVLDYEGAQAALGNLVVDQISMDQEIPQAPPTGREDLRQWCWSVNLRWIEQYG